MIEILESGDMSADHEEAWNYTHRRYGHRGIFSRYLSSVCLVSDRQSDCLVGVYIYDMYAPRRLSVVKDDHGKLLRYEVNAMSEFWPLLTDGYDTDDIKQRIYTDIKSIDKFWLDDQCNSDYHDGGMGDLAVVHSDFVGDADGVLQIYPNRDDEASNQFAVLVTDCTADRARACELKNRLHRGCGKRRGARYLAFCGIFPLGGGKYSVVAQVFDRCSVKALRYFDYGTEQRYFQEPAWSMCFTQCVYTTGAVAAAVDNEMKRVCKHYVKGGLDVVLQPSNQFFSPYNRYRLPLSL